MHSCDAISLVHPHTGKVIPTQLFVGALGASSCTFLIANLSQELPGIRHVRNAHRCLNRFVQVLLSVSELARH